MGYKSVIDLAALSADEGFRINGAIASDFSGTSVANAGDINGDGFVDLIVGAFQADPAGRNQAGSNYVLFGKASGFGTVDLASLAPSQGFRIDGAAQFDQSGRFVSAAGDINNDGFADLVLGVALADPNGHTSAGSSYVVFGKAAGFADIDLANLASNTGFRIDGTAEFDFSGLSVSGAGDVNNDGFDDIIVGATGADPSNRNGAGSSYVILGKASGFGSIELASLSTSQGFRIDGAVAGDGFGFSVSGAGDVNGDGFADVIVGAYQADPAGRNSAGSSYIVFGQASGFATVDLASLAASQGFRIDGAVAGDSFGSSVSGAGDVNGDGFADLIIGARGAGSNYVIFGKAAGFSTIDLASLSASQGFRIYGAAAGSDLGISVAGAGDVNGDGVADLIVGAPEADPYGRFSAGSSYVVFGQASGLSNIDLANLAPTQGFRIDGGAAADRSGFDVSGAGDVNGDGLADLIVGAYQADPFGRGDAGTSYVVFGQSSGSIIRSGGAGADTLRGYAFDDSLTGLAGADLLTGQGGDDTLSGGGEADTLLGGDGIDRLFGGAGGDLMQGGLGNDFYQVDAAGDQVIETGSDIDTVESLLGFYALMALVENLRLAAIGPSNGDGNGLDNVVTGSGGDNILRGLDGNDTINGAAGSDFIAGGAGADSMDGGADFDAVSWQDATAAVTVNMTNQALNAGQAAGDLALNVEAFYLSGFSDSFVNGSAGGYIYGFGGNDTITGGSGSEFIDGGVDTDAIDGGGGFDYVSYANAAAGVRLDLTNPASNTGEAAGDTLANIETFFLSGFGDVFVGQAGQNIVFGLGGADSLTGGANSNDWLFGGEGNDTLTGGTLNDLLSGEGGADTFAFTSWVGNGFDSVFTFTSGVDRIQLTGSGFSVAAGSLSNGFNFVSGAAPTPSGVRPTVLYNTTNGILSFDLDGTGTAFGVTPLAQFGGAPTLVASDFVVV